MEDEKAPEVKGNSDTPTTASLVPPVEPTIPSEPAPAGNLLTKIKNILSRRTFAVVGIVVSAAIVAGGVFAYQNVYLAPERVLERSLGAMEEVKSFGFDGRLALTFSSDEAGVGLAPLFLANTFTVNMDGKIDGTNEEDSRSDVRIDVKSGTTTFADMHLIGIGETAYLNIEDLSGLEAAIGGPQGGGIFSVFTNKWIKIDEESLEQFDYTESTPNSTEIDSEEISGLLSEHNPFKITQQLPSEEINGQDMFHYGFDLDKENLKTFLIKLQEVLYKDNKLGPNAKANLEDSVEKLELKGGEIWIGKSDYYLTKFTVGINQVDEESSMEFGLDITFTFKDHGEPANIIEPTEYVTAAELLEELQYLFAPVAPAPLLY